MVSASRDCISLHWLDMLSTRTATVQHVMPVKAPEVHWSTTVRLGAAAGAGIWRSAPVAVRVAKEQPGLPGPVELAVRQVVAHQVTPVVGEPQVAGLRVPVKAHTVAHTCSRTRGKRSAAEPCMQHACR